MSHNIIHRRQQGSRPQEGNRRNNNNNHQLDEFKQYASDPATPMIHGDDEAAQQLLTTTTDNNLQVLRVFELHKDGSSQYLDLTVRGVYRHVLNAITDRKALALASTMKKIATLNKLKKAAAFAFAAATPTTTTTTTTTAEPPAAAATMPTMVSTSLPGTIHEEESPPADDNPVFEPTSLTASTHEAEGQRPNLARFNPRLSMESTRNVLGETAVPAPAASAAAPNNSSSNMNNSNRSITNSNNPRTTTAAPPPTTTYRERLGGYLHPRDMRRLVTPFSTSNEPDLIVRRHVVLLNFDPIRAIILRDRLLVLVPSSHEEDEEKEGRGWLAKIEKRVRGGSAELEHSIFGDNNGDGASERGGGKKKVLNALLRRSGSNSGKAPPTIKIPTKDLEPRTLSGLSGDGDDTMTAKTDASEDGTEMSTSEDEDGLPDEWREMEAREWVNLPFELQCAEAVLHEVSSILSQDTIRLQKAAKKHMDRVIHCQSFNDDPLVTIRTVKNAVQQMTNRVKGFAKSMHRILEDDKDMALMNLSRLVSHPERFIQPVPQRVLDEESDEPELILEANLQNASTLLNIMDLMNGEIVTAKESVDQKQDATRNRLLFANMMISVFSLCVTMASLVGSFFGMNVPNGYENELNNDVYKKIIGYTMTGSISICFFIMAVLWYSGTIPHTVRALAKDIEL